MNSCTYYDSGLSVYGETWKNHLLTGKGVKCDDCRNEVWFLEQDAPAYVCNVCSNGFGECCGPNHTHEQPKEPEPEPEICSPDTMHKYESGVSFLSGSYAQDFANGESIACHGCDMAMWWTAASDGEGNDGPLYWCRVCKKMICNQLCDPKDHK
jgi:hypothetical protein